MLSYRLNFLARNHALNYWALFALASSSFVIGASEFVIVGLLSDIANDLYVSIAQAGLLISAYALSVVLGGPLLAVLTFRLPRKTTLMLFCLCFVLGNLLCALASSYAWLMFARVVAALAHGAFFGIASVSAATLCVKEKRGDAIALVFMGLTLANVLGVPLGALVGEQYGWRFPFFAIAAMGVASLCFLALFLPNTIPMPKGKVLREFMILKRFNVQMPLALSVVASTSLFCLVTYIKPILLDVTMAGNAAIVPIMAIFGIGLTIGSILGGKLANAHVIANTIFVMLAVIGIMLAMYFALPHLFAFGAAILLWGAVAFALCPMLQMMILVQARAAPNLASTFNQSAFNLGNSLGAALGAGLIDNGMPLAFLPLVSACVMLFGIFGALHLLRYVGRH